MKQTINPNRAGGPEFPAVPKDMTATTEAIGQTSQDDSVLSHRSVEPGGIQSKQAPSAAAIKKLELQQQIAALKKQLQWINSELETEVASRSVNEATDAPKKVAKSLPVEDEGETLARAYSSVEKIGYLSKEEVRAAVPLARALHPGMSLKFVEVSHAEPTKQELIEAVKNGSQLPRRVEVVTQCLATNQVFVDVVDVPLNASFSAKAEAVSSKVLDSVQPGMSHEEYAYVDAMCKTYEPLRAAIARRGLNPDYVVADAWCVADHTPTERVAWPSLYYRDPATDDLPYARPIDGLSMRISLVKREVIAFDDSSFDNFPIPGSYDANSHYYPAEKLRTDLKPIVITQPEGPSFTVLKGNQVHWQKWSMQIGFTSKEGCFLSGICYDGRPILHRFSMVEMVVPYGDPRPPHCWKNAFDAGEDGLGRNANSLVLGCDCLGHIHYFDANLVGDNGEAETIVNAVCMHEEDASIAWKHTDWRTGVPMVARSRRLVVSFICTIANYEYGFYYHFYLDGNIEVDVKLTGVLSTGALTVEEQEQGGRKYGTSLSKTLYAAAHQHFFVARMDFAIDGYHNSVVEWNAQADEDMPEDDPNQSAFYFTSKTLGSELAARRHCCSDTSRFWQVVNTNLKNSIGGHPSYRLNAKTSIKPFADLERSISLRRAKFLAYQLWVTQCAEGERFPGGDFPNQCQTLEGLPLWTQQDRDLENTDVVLWHVFGVTHCPRPEEWPIMPAEHCGFKLTPFGFFDHSPAMDIPTTVHLASLASAAPTTEVVEEKKKTGCCGGKKKPSSPPIDAADGLVAEGRWRTMPSEDPTLTARHLASLSVSGTALAGMEDARGGGLDSPSDASSCSSGSTSSASAAEGSVLNTNATSTNVNTTYVRSVRSSRSSSSPDHFREEDEYEDEDETELKLKVSEISNSNVLASAAKKVAAAVAAAAASKDEKA